MRLQVHAPDRRFVDLEVDFDSHSLEVDRKPGWPAGFRRVDQAFVDSLGAWCRDDRAMGELLGPVVAHRNPPWSTGDLWLSCERFGKRILRFSVIWNPDRRAVTIEVAADPAAIEQVLDRVARPLLDASQLRWLTPDNRELHGSYEDGLHVEQYSASDFVSIEITSPMPD